jgi:glucuronate isomerase
MTRPFIHDRFLLESDLAFELYQRVARDLPIFDYHTHLSPEKIAANHRFRGITELWLEGDHYKWRAMRAHGVTERLCSGDGSDWEKFEAWAATVPETLCNPLHHWTHMELARPFGIDTLLGPETARATYDRCNERLGEDGFTARGLLHGFRVSVVCTTDDPTDDLKAHAHLARATASDLRVFPTWRPDRALRVEDPASWNVWADALAEAANMDVAGWGSFLEALDQRHAAFDALGCRASDHGLEAIPADPWSDREVESSFDAVRAGRALDAGAAQRLRSALLHRLALMDSARGWVQQFHLGALRNNRSRILAEVGPDAGCDSIGDFEMARPLARFLDALDAKNALPKTILYNLNPRDNELFATMVGNFHDGGVPGKMQYGPAWWFLDQREGNEAQIRALANLGLLSRFVGMVTDSRSFLSYSRHDYFRRVLCNFLGEQARRGFVPDDRETLGRLVTAVCFDNARDYFAFPAAVEGTGVA